MKALITYRFGRANLLNALAGESKKQQVLVGLGYGGHGKTIPSRKETKWGFFEIKEYTTPDGEEWVHGYLVKYKESKEEEVVIEATQEIKDETVNNRIEAKSRFFMHIVTGIIAYHPVSNHISDEQFTKHFDEVFNRNHDEDNPFVRIVIEAIDKRQRLLDELARFSMISQVSITLHPSNPGSSIDWEPQDNWLKKLRIAVYQEKFVAVKNQGLQISDDPDTLGKIAMSVDGYGKSEVTGMLDGKEQTVSSGNNPETVDLPNDDAEDEELLTALHAAWKPIAKRDHE